MASTDAVIWNRYYYIAILRNLNKILGEWSRHFVCLLTTKKKKIQKVL